MRRHSICDRDGMYEIARHSEERLVDDNQKLELINSRFLASAMDLAVMLD